MIRIVRSNSADAERVLQLVDRLLRELEERPDEFEGIDRAKVRRDMASAGERFTAFLAQTREGETVGLATVMEAFAIYAGGNYGIIDEMYVLREHRSKGVGRLILDAIKEHGRRKSWLRIDVTAPPEPRFARTVTFYERQGFVFTGPKLRFKLSDPSARK